MDSIQLMHGGGSLALSTGSRDLRPRNLKIVISQASFAFFLVLALLGVFVFSRAVFQTNVLQVLAALVSAVAASIVEVIDHTDHIWMTGFSSGYIYLFLFCVGIRFGSWFLYLLRRK